MWLKERQIKFQNPNQSWHTTIFLGIGNADDLKALDIPVVAHVPGVGQNLQDHLEIYVVQKCKKPVTLLKDQKFPRMIQVGLQWFYNQTGAAGTTHLESGGFTRSRPGVAHPDIMFHFLPSQVFNAQRIIFCIIEIDAKNLGLVWIS